MSDAMKKAIEENIDTRSVGKDGNTLLHVAAATGNEAVVKTLIQGGVDTHSRFVVGGKTMGWIEQCYECGNEVTLAGKYADDPANAKELRKLGWVYREGIGWTCPECKGDSDVCPVSGEDCEMAKGCTAQGTHCLYKDRG